MLFRNARAGVQLVAVAWLLADTHAAVSRICALYSNLTDGSSGFGIVNNITGVITSQVSVTRPSTLVSSVDSGKRAYLISAGNSLEIVEPLHGTVNHVNIVAPSGYTGAFLAQSIAVDGNISAPVAALVAQDSSWAVVATIDSSTGRATARGDITAQYFSSNYSFSSGVAAIDSVSGVYWLVTRGSHGSDLAVGFTLDAPTGTQPTIVPLPEGNNVTSLTFGGPFFSGPGLVALVTNPDSGHTLTLLGSFLNEGGQPDWFETQNYNASAKSEGLYQLALSRDEMTAYVGMRVGGSSVVSIVDTLSNQPLGGFTAQAYTVLGLVAC